MFEKALASFHKSKCLHPTCYTHGKLAQMRIVKDSYTEDHTLFVPTKETPARSANGQIFVSPKTDMSPWPIASCT